MQPQIIEDTISIAANSVNDNVLVSNPSLKVLQRVPYPCKGTLVAVQSASGLGFSLDYGSKNVVADSNSRIGSDMQEPLDVVNDDWYANEGDMLILRVANSTAGALSLTYRIRLDPLVHDGEGDFTLPPDTRVMQKGNISIPANAIDFQLLNGLRYERPPVPSILTVLMTQATGGTLNRSLFIDTERIAPPSKVVTNNRVPQDPFDISVGGIEVPADKEIQIPVTNPTGVAINVFWKQKLKEIYRA